MQKQKKGGRPFPADVEAVLARESKALSQPPPDTSVAPKQYEWWPQDEHGNPRRHLYRALTARLWEFRGMEEPPGAGVAAVAGEPAGGEVAADAAQGGSQPTLSTGRVEERDSVVDQTRATVMGCFGEVTDSR